MRLIFTLFLLLAATSCKSPTLSVETGFFSRKDLASSVVDTPDPNKQKPIFGQRLYINWHLTPQEFAQKPVELKIQVRLKKDQLLEETVPITTASGSYIFPIVGDNFTKNRGLLSYQIKIIGNGHELAASRHKFWVDQIQFSE
jgi:hypothetical protein